MKDSASTTHARKHARVTAATSTSASFFDLKAELEQSKKAAGSTRNAAATSSGLDHRVKGKTLFSASRAASDASHKDPERKKKRKTEDTPTRSQLDAIRRNLERKAKIYAQLEAGKHAGISDDQLTESCIDWQRKALETPAPSSRASPPPPELMGSYESDSVVEYVDEFGRSRTSRLSEVPRELLSTVPGYQDPAADHSEEVIRGPATQFPVYIPTAAKRTSSPSTSHFNPDSETRHRGAAFFKFSSDESTRSQQMDELHQLRQHTLNARSSKHLD